MLRFIAPLLVGAAVGAVATGVALRLHRGSADSEMLAFAVTSETGELPGADSVSSAARRPAGFNEEEALASLALLERAADVRAGSLAVLEVIGHEREDIARIAAALPAADRLNFTFDAIASLAAKDPANAIEFALALDGSSSRSEAIRRVANVLGGIDPQSALAYGDSIGNYELTDVFRSAVLEAWAGNDPDGFLAFVESTASPSLTRRAGDAFAVAAAVRPDEVLALLERLPQSVRLSAERAALDVLVMTDTRAALEHLESLPMGSARDSLYRSTAQSYAGHDLDAALAWAGAIQPPSNPAMTGVLWVLAKSDPVRGANVLIERLRAAAGPNAGFDANAVLQGFTPGPPALMSLVAERLSSVDDSVVATLYNSFINDWAGSDPEAAYDWALASPDRLTLAAASYLAQNLARARPELAKRAADRLPPDMQRTWIRVVAGALARSNLDDALQWVARYQGQSVYQDAFGAALESASLMGRVENPAALASFLDRQSADMRAESVAVVANVWAERDPEAAARWVERTELTEAAEESRSAAISNVAARWAAQDAGAAENWALALPEGELRDRALGAVLSVTSRTGRVDARLLDAFSSDAAAQRSLTGTAMMNLGRSDPELGRELIQQYITDPATRAEAEELLIRGPSDPFAGGDVVSIR